jgi:hypothetical protein
MGRRYVFADESGNFDFSRNAGASKYFILTTIVLHDCSVGQSLLELRRELAWEGLGLNNEFHATTDLQVVRDRVFAAIVPHHLRVDATILEKSKASPSIRATDDRFYKMAWYLHMKYVGPQIVSPSDELLVVGASLGTRKRRALFHSAVDDVVRQVSPTIEFRVASWDGVSDPCLQVADYCAWAIQRKWELDDLRSYSLIRGKISSEFAPFASGTRFYY